MKFGIKTKIDKIKNYLYSPEFIFKDLKNNTFPGHPYPKININLRLAGALHDEAKTDYKHRVGTLIAKADGYAVKIYQKFISANPNNIGNWSVAVPYGGTKLVEYEVIHKLIDLYKCRNQDIEGYITSGGTEGNLFSIWLAKAFITKKYNLNQICLLKTVFTHYSIDKACFIGSIKTINIPLNRKLWVMDPVALESEIKNQISQGIYGFIIALTFGYSQTGMCDDMDLISTVIRKLKKIYKKIVVSIVVDAAFNGLIEPFINREYEPFLNRDIHVFSVDFSKLTAVPYPAGAVFYRRHLRKVIESRVDVSPLKDNTLLGSRTGAAAAAIWGTIHSQGISGFYKIIKKQIELKNYFIKNIIEIYPDCELINNSNSLTCGIILNKRRNISLATEVEKKYWIYSKNEKIQFSDGSKKIVRLYKFYFLPHITKKAIDDILFTFKKSLTV